MKMSLLEKLAAAAAQASAPAGGQANPAAAGAAGADGADPNMMAMPDPIEQDNMRLTNILQNLQLRQEVVQAQADLEQLTREMSMSKKKVAKDPDAPVKGTSIIDDVTSADAISDILKRTPKTTSNRGELKSGKKQSRGTAGGKNKQSPVVPGRSDIEANKVAPIQDSGQ